jgi:hypothetical protein
MKHPGDRAIELAKSAVIGYLTVLVVCLFAVVVLAGAALATGVSSLNIGIGPIPLMSFWNSASGYGFQSQWGIGVLTGFGAVAGLGLAIHRQLIRAASRSAPAGASSSGPSEGSRRLSAYNSGDGDLPRPRRHYSAAA